MARSASPAGLGPYRPRRIRDTQGSGVPEGTITSILKWVGNDPARARQALEAERGRSAPRVTLTESLEGLTESLSTPNPSPDVPGGSTDPVGTDSEQTEST